MSVNIFGIQQKPRLANLKTTPAPAVPNGSMSRLMAAAVVDQQFCRALLANPMAAVERGFGNETFNLTPAEKKLVMSVKNPANLPDFARQLIRNYNNG